MLGFAFATAAILGFLLVRTFRSPALEAADVPLEEETVDTGRDPVPPQATMPGAPDSGWMEAGGSAAVPGALPPGQPGTLEPVPGTARVRGLAPAARPETARRTYTDADLRALAAARGADAARDRGYIVGLRQRRVDDLTERLAQARSSDERAKLRAWLSSAQHDLERAQRE
jgi:hypothetical protein